MRGSCLRSLKTPPKPFFRKGKGEAGLVVANFLVSGTLFLRSGHGQEVPVILQQKNVISCSDKKGQGPKAQLSASNIQVLNKRGQISAGSSLRPGPQTLLSHYREGARCPGPSWPSGGPSSGGRSPGWHDGTLCRLLPPLGRRGRGGVRVTSKEAWAWPVAGRESILEPCRTQSSACSLGPPPTHPLAQDEVTWRAQGKG